MVCALPLATITTQLEALGNEQPHAESIAKWISPDRLFVEVIMVAENPDGSESTRADETESSVTPSTQF